MNSSEKLCVGCGLEVPSGRRSFCSTQCAQRVKQQRFRARKKNPRAGNSGGTSAGVRDSSITMQAQQRTAVVIDEIPRRRAAQDYSKRVNRYASELAELLDLCEHYREQNDELHAYAMAQNTANALLHQQLVEARAEATTIASILLHVLTTQHVPVIPAEHIRLLERYRTRLSSL